MYSSSLKFLKKIIKHKEGGVHIALFPNLKAASLVYQIFNKTTRILQEFVEVFIFRENCWSKLAPLINFCSNSRSLSPQTINSDPSSPESQKTPLIICNLNLQPNVKTLAPKVKRSVKKLPPFCVQFQNAINRNSAIQESNIKTINDFIVQGTLIANHRRRNRQKSHATHLDSPDIIINCEDDDCNECKNSFSDNVFNNINTDLVTRPNVSRNCFQTLFLFD